MERHEIGKFYAKTFNDIVIEFIVFNDKTIDCPMLGIKSICTIELKPRFTLRGKGFYYTYDAKPNRKFDNYSELICDYEIFDDLFAYLKQNNMIIYSTDMAYFYGFKDKDGYDNNQYGVGSPYKWAKKKGPILEKQKKGQFN